MVIFLVEMIILDETLDGKIDIFYEILLSVYDIPVVIGSFFFLFEHVWYMYLCLLQCLQLVTKTCRCGQKQKEVLCSKQYLCETKCSAMRDCNKHQCKRKVCVHLIIVLYCTVHCKLFHH